MSYFAHAHTRRTPIKCYTVSCHILNIDLSNVTVFPNSVRNGMALPSGTSPAIHTLQEMLYICCYSHAYVKMLDIIAVLKTKVTQLSICIKVNGVWSPGRIRYQLPPHK